MTPIARLVAALVSCELKVFVCPVDTRNLTAKQRVEITIADVVIRELGASIGLTAHGKHKILASWEVADLVTKLESSPHGPAMAMRVLRGVA